MSETKEINKHTQIVVVEKMNQKQQIAADHLRRLAFSNIDPREVEEDFYRPQKAHVLAYIGDNFVGWAGIHTSTQPYESETIKLGGYGICTHPDWQGRGIASQVSLVALDYLKDLGSQVGFLSVELSNIASVKLHQKHGFVILPREFSWTNSKGKLKSSLGGMVAPITSDKKFDIVLHGADSLYVGNGYW